ncbi:hypothetical protein DEG02_011175 [Xanthomonas vasicola]|nr:hypothetical protein KWO_004335 [Xanthomonas vasicola pv. musacearum NCPPB 4379]AZR33810.1 hypothetical protein NX08_004225 [Xanthomonas vasicola]RRJ43575.1 hypothetical protein EIM46_03715 [Xanthomonas vasicola pv. musacearum]RJL98304.1 hypothetical protein DEG05_006745 [Xanthomonas vasicola]RJN02352.1 hypothetical protein DEF97_010395 [Xanthomonas vasicola]
MRAPDGRWRAGIALLHAQSGQTDHAGVAAAWTLSALRIFTCFKVRLEARIGHVVRWPFLTAQDVTRHGVSHDAHAG